MARLCKWSRIVRRRWRRPRYARRPRVKLRRWRIDRASTHARLSSRDRRMAVSVRRRRRPVVSALPATAAPTFHQAPTRSSRAPASTQSKRPANRRRRTCRTWTNVSPATSRRLIVTAMSYAMSCQPQSFICIFFCFILCFFLFSLYHVHFELLLVISAYTFVIMFVKDQSINQSINYPLSDPKRPANKL